MPQVHTAIHVRTGHGVHAQHVDAWLARHAVAVTAHDDAYAACVHLLTHYAQIPEFALVGADWLAPDEYELVAFIRHTWPRTVIVLYGDAPESAGFATWPLVRTCVGSAGVDRLCAESPAQLVALACVQLPRPATGKPRRAHLTNPALGLSTPAAWLAPAPWPPRTLLTPEELASLTDPHAQV